jgi:symplekin
MRISTAIQFATQAGVNSITNDLNFTEDDEEYEPDYEPMEDAEQLKNRLEMESSEDLGIGIPKPSQINIGPFILPTPPPLQRSDLQLLAMSTMDQMFRHIDLSSQASHQPPRAFGLNKLVNRANDRDSMTTAFARLLTRPSSGIFPEAQTNGSVGLSKKASHSAENGTINTSLVKSLTDRGRLQLLQYILNDWTRRMDIATSWLTEEWYNDTLAQKAYDEAEDKDGSSPPVKNYPRWIRRFLDELSAFIGGEHSKLLIRFVSEIPGIDVEIVAKIKRLALDPERITMVVNAL